MLPPQLYAGAGLDGDTNSDDDGYAVGGGKGPRSPPSKARKHATQRDSAVTSPPLPSVMIEIDMSPSVSKLKADEMERRREAMKAKQESRARQREEARKKSKEDETK